MALALIGLITGLVAGLMRIGWAIPVSGLAVHHGAIMVGGFLSTLIALEKVIPLKRKILYSIPLMNALTLIMIIPGGYDVGRAFMLAGSIGLVLIFFMYWYQHPSDQSNQLMVVGAMLLVTGNILFIVHQFYPSSLLWWMGFILFTITAERLELSRFLPVSRQQKLLLLLLLALFPLGIILPHHSVAGQYVVGMSLAGIAMWMLRNDVIRIGLRKEALRKFSAVALFSGNLALLLSGVLVALSSGNVYAYDSFVHTFFLGYVFSMIFAHGPIILPGVLGLSAKPYHPALYIWLMTLLASLLLRLTANTLLEVNLRKISGLISALCIMFYFVTLVVQVVRQRHAKIS
jgi:hypothetical protein